MTSNQDRLKELDIYLALPSDSPKCVYGDGGLPNSRELAYRRALTELRDRLAALTFSA